MRLNHQLAFVALLASAVCNASSASAETRYVRTNGDDIAWQAVGFAIVPIVNFCTSSSNPCRTLQHALRLAENGDKIVLATGIYGGSVEVDGDLSNVLVQGGWNSSFSGHTPLSVGTEATVLNNGVSLIAAPGHLDLTFEHLRIRSQNDSSRSALRARSGAVVDWISSSDLSGFATATARMGEISLTLRSVDLLGVGRSVDARSGAFSALDLRFRDVEASAAGAAKLEARSYSHLSDYADSGSSRLAFDVEDSTFRNAGISVYARGAGARALVYVQRSDIRESRGSGIYASTPRFDSFGWNTVDLIIENSFIVQSAESGVVAIGDVSGWLTNDTIANNGGFGIWRDAYFGNEPLRVSNTIVWGNGPGDIYQERGTTIASYSDIGTVDDVYGVYDEGDGVLSVGPLFADEDGGDFHLNASSPLINQGTCSGDADFDGDIRFSLSGIDRCDIGADEVRVKVFSPDWLRFWIFR